jgi:Flp pilus assembly protein TadD
MRSAATRIVLLAVGVLMHAGCTSHRAPSLADRFLLHRSAKPGTAKPDAPESPSLEEAIGKVRQLMATARPEPRQQTPTVEATDPALKLAFTNLSAAQTDDRLYDVGAAYHQLGLLDQAYQYYNRALHLNRRHASSHEGLARVWRDWGFPLLGLGDAHRATFYAPASPSAENTLGTVLHALGRRDEARAAYQRALLLEHAAPYALNNLCYLSLVEGHAAQALEECRGALRADPALSAAHNNLALTYASLGRLDLARREFELAGGTTSPAYNMGIVYLAQDRFALAAHEFETARLSTPIVVDAARRARASRTRAGADPTNRGEQ